MKPDPCHGQALGDIYYLRTAADEARIAALLLRPGASLVMVSAGLIGLEVAASARVLGYDVIVLEAGAQGIREVSGTNAGPRGQGR